MSTKVYNAFSVKMSFLEFYNSLENDIAPLIKKFSLEKLNTIALQNAMESFDLATLKGEKPVNVLGKSIIAIWDRQRKVETTRERDPEIDYGCEILVYPTKTRMYFRLLTEHDEVCKFFSDKLSSFDIRDESYWNNTDRAEDVSVKEWRRRAKFWDSQQDKKPMCYTARQTNEHFFIQNNEVSRFMPSFQSRVKKVATRLAADLYPKKSEQAFSFSDFFDWINGEEFEELKIAKSKEISPLLKAEVSVEDLKLTEA